MQKPFSWKLLDAPCSLLAGLETFRSLTLLDDTITENSLVYKSDFGLSGYVLVTHGMQKKRVPRVFQESLLLGLSRNASPHFDSGEKTLRDDPNNGY